MKRRTCFFVALGLISVAAVAVIVHVVGLRGTLGVLRDAGLRAFVALLLLTTLWMVLLSVAWDLLGRPVGHRIPFWTLFKGTLIGYVGNFMTPSMYLGGEPLRIAYVGRRHQLPYYQVAGTVLLAKYLEFMAFVLTICVGTGVALAWYWHTISPVVRWLVAAGATVFLTILVLLVVSLRGRHRPISAVTRWLMRRGICRKALEPRLVAVQQMEDQISRIFNREGLAAWPAFACLLGGFVTLFLRPFAFFLFVKEGKTTFSFPELCLIYALTQFVLGLQITPGSLGAYEAGIIGIFAMLDIPREQAFAYVICIRTMDVLQLLAGVLAGTQAGFRMLKFLWQSGTTGSAGSLAASASDPNAAAPANPPVGPGTPPAAPPEPPSTSDRAGDERDRGPKGPADAAPPPL